MRRLGERKVPLALVTRIHSSLVVVDTANKPYVTRDRRDGIKEMRMRLAIEYSIGISHFRYAHSIHSPVPESLRTYVNVILGEVNSAVVTRTPS